jgi:hypothetical protein
MNEALPEHTFQLLVLLPILAGASLSTRRLAELAFASSVSPLIRTATTWVGLAILAAAGLYLHHRLMLAQAHDFMAYIESGPLYLVHVEPSAWTRPFVVFAAVLPGALGARRAAA